MSISVYLTKRYTKETTAGGKRKYRWHLRWKDAATGKWKWEATGTADKTRAKHLQERKWDEVNGRVEPSTPPTSATWDDCRDAFTRAMEAENLRPSYVLDSAITFDGLRKMFPEATIPAQITPAMAQEYKARRHEAGRSSWTIKGDLATLKAIFGKWLVKTCGLLTSNPFADVTAPKTEDIQPRIVTPEECEAFYTWLSTRWGGWDLPLVYLNVLGFVGWRATETASIQEDDIYADGTVRVKSSICKTRKDKYGWLPEDLHSRLLAGVSEGWAFGRFSDELRRRLSLVRGQHNAAARVKDFSPKRLVGWMQDELKRYNEEIEAAARKAGEIPAEPFTLHDFRRTAITRMYSAGASEKETSTLVGATPEVIRKHYEGIDRRNNARKVAQRLLDQDKQTIRFPVVCSAVCAEG
jgi:integrase